MQGCGSAENKKKHPYGKKEDETIVQEGIRKRDDRGRDSKGEHERWNENE